MHNAFMVNLTIRDVPQETRDELAARARRKGQSLQEFVRATLVRAADQADQEELWAEVERRVAREGTQLSADWIVEAIREDRDR